MREKTSSIAMDDAHRYWIINFFTWSNRRPPQMASSSSDVAVSIPAASPSEPSAPAKPSAPPKVSYSRLFRFATPFEVLLTVLGALCGAANGVVFPCFSVIFGALLNAYSMPGAALGDIINQYALYFLYLSIGAAVASYLQTALPMLSAERQVMRARARYLSALLRQPPCWHDTNAAAGEVSTRLSESMLLIQGGMGEKMAGALQHGTCFVAGLIVGFVTSWRLTLVIFACSEFTTKRPVRRTRHP